MLKNIRLLALLCIVAAGAVIGTEPAFARPRAGEVTYWSDSAHTQAVGSVLTDCDGNTYSWGVITAYHTFESFAC